MEIRMDAIDQGHMLKN